MAPKGKEWDGMTIHLVKLCVGATSVDDLSAWQKTRRTKHWKQVGRRCAYHTTRQFPRRETDLRDGGSIYWVIKGVVQVRQLILGLEATTNENGIPSCALLLDPELVPVMPQPRRAFQGWRYLEPGDAPSDILETSMTGIGDMPVKLRQDLAALCLI